VATSGDRLTATSGYFRTATDTEAIGLDYQRHRRAWATVWLT
jgi:hypothetical protein